MLAKVVPEIVLGRKTSRVLLSGPNIYEGSSQTVKFQSYRAERLLTVENSDAKNERK